MAAEIPPRLDNPHVQPHGTGTLGTKPALPDLPSQHIDTPHMTRDLAPRRQASRTNTSVLGRLLQGLIPSTIIKLTVSPCPVSTASSRVRPGYVAWLRLDGSAGRLASGGERIQTGGHESRPPPLPLARGRLFTWVVFLAWLAQCAVDPFVHTLPPSLDTDRPKKKTEPGSHQVTVFFPSLGGLHGFELGWDWTTGICLSVSVWLLALACLVFSLFPFFSRPFPPVWALLAASASSPWQY